MLTSTLLILLVLPSVYAIMEDIGVIMITSKNDAESEVI
jgi:hypothetical protein